MSILRTVVFEEYNRSLAHIKTLLDKLKESSCKSQKKRLEIQLKNRVDNVKFARKCLDITEKCELLEKANKYLKED